YIIGTLRPSRSPPFPYTTLFRSFLLVAVESFRRSPEADFLSKTGGSGGFALIAETDLPLYRDPNSREGRQDILDALEKVYQRDPDRKSTRLNSSHRTISYAVFCL